MVRNPGGQKQPLRVERFFSGEHQLDDPVRKGIRSVVLPDGAWEVKHRDDRRIFLPLDLPGVGPPPTLAEMTAPLVPSLYSTMQAFGRLPS